MWSRYWITQAFTALVLGLSPYSHAWAQQPVRPLVKTGPCPTGYFTSAGYCVPNRSGTSRGAIEKLGGHCPTGFSTSGGYCLSHPSNRREAIKKSGSTCPSGWFTSGRYCLRNP